MGKSVILNNTSFSALTVNKNRLLKRIISITPFAVLCCSAIIKFIVWPELYFWLIREDGVIENCTFLVYFVTFIAALSVALRFCKNRQNIYGLLYFIFCAGMFYIAMEEISWGQRIFNMKTSEFFNTYNYQKEMNTHNFLSRSLLHGLYILVGFYGAFIWLVLPKKVKIRYSSELDYFVPNSYLFFYFLPVFAFYFYWDYLSIFEPYVFGNQFIRDRFIHGKDQELAELLLSFGFLIFVLFNKFRQGTSKHLHNQEI